MDQGKSKTELERDSRNEESGQQEDVDFTIGQTVELDQKPNVIPKRGRTKKIIQVAAGLDYWEREKLQPLEKVQQKDIVRNKVEPKEEKRVKKLMYIEDPEKIQVTRREREMQQRLPELKSQRELKFLFMSRIQEHATYRFEKESRTTNEPPKHWKEKSTRP